MKTYILTFILFITYSLSAGGPAPSITSVVPITGSSSGGQQITINGSNFSGATAVNFGADIFGVDIPSPSFSVNPAGTVITATTPQHAPEIVQITVTTPSGTSPPTPNAYFVFQGDSRAFITNTVTGNVSVLDVNTNTIIATIPIKKDNGGGNPKAVAISADGRKVVVANNTDLSVSIINNDTTPPSFVTTTNIAPDNFPAGIVIALDKSKTYVANDNSGTVTILDINNAVIARPTVGSNPQAIAITPDNSKIFVANKTSANVTVIDGFTNAVISPPITGIPVGFFPVALAITPDGKKCFVVNNNSNNVTVIDVATLMVTNIISVGDNPCAIAIRFDGKRAYVTNKTDLTVSVIDVDAETVINPPVSVSNFPDCIVTTPDGKIAYVTDNNNGVVSILNITADPPFISVIPKNVGNNPLAIVVNPIGNNFVCVNSTSDSVSTLTSEIPLKKTTPVVYPVAIAITPDQSPLARFSVTIMPAGQPTTFDASASASPVGMIVNYFWDFGDGNTENTPNATTTHTYLNPGPYTVTLTVTNSAGTSITQIFTPSSSNDLSYNNDIVFNNTFLSNNGSLLARTSLQIIIPAPTPPIPPTPVPVIPCICCPPTHFEVKKVKPFFALAHFNVLTWDPPQCGCIIGYKIFRVRGNLCNCIATITCPHELKFVDFNPPKGINEYFIVSINSCGVSSCPMRTEVKN